MRVLHVLAISLLALTACERASRAEPPAASNGGLVILEPENPERPYFHDFGSLRDGERVGFTYLLENRGAAPVTVRDLLADCGCTIPTISYTEEDGTVVTGVSVAAGPVIVLPPGVVAELRVLIDTTLVRTKNKDWLSVVRLRSDSPETPYLTFELHLVVLRSFHVTPAEINLGPVGRGLTGSGKADIVSEPRDSGAAVLRVSATSPGLSATVQEVHLDGLPYWVLAVLLDPVDEVGPYRGFVDLATVDVDGVEREQGLRVPVSARVTEEVYPVPARLWFKTITRGEPARAEVKLHSSDPGRRILVTDAEVRGVAADHLTVELTPLYPDDRGRSAEWSVLLLADETLDVDTFTGNVLLELDDDQIPSVTVPYGGVVADGR